MKLQQEILSTPIIGKGALSSATWRGLRRRERLRIQACVGAIILLTLLFIQPLISLMIHAAQSDLHSHIPLVPFIAAYLLYVKRTTLVAAYRSHIAGAVLVGGIGCLALLGSIALRGSLSFNDYLALLTLASVSFLAAGGFLFLGARAMAAAAFPVAILLFLIPLPDAAVFWLERGSVLASTEVAALLFQWTGTPLLRDGTFLTLPGIVLEVAQECSGIRSSWVLFITSVVASHLFLQTSWRRVVLVAFVIPLGILRNGFRILVIGLLCVHVGPHMADSAIHRRGGPIFFVLSLVPLFALLVWLRRRERRLQSAAQQPPVSEAAA
jgi:exosortase C (VPDSG-CTERM-specific)